MPLNERVYSVLIVSASEKLNRSLAALFPEKDFSPVRFVGSVGEAQRSMVERPYDLVLINTPLPDDFGRKFAIDVCANPSCVAMLLVKSELYDETYDHVVDYGVLTLRKPTTLSILTQSLDYMRAARERLRRLERKAVSLEDKMAEIRIVNRAKWALIETCKMTESDAHRYIEKQAMDRCVTRREIAENILQTYRT
jgi:response regulator NasT